MLWQHVVLRQGMLLKVTNCWCASCASLRDTHIEKYVILQEEKNKIGKSNLGQK